MTQSDWNLLAKFSQDEDHAAFATLVKRHRPLVEATCRRVLGDHGDADDAVQAAFFQLARNAEQLTRDSAPERSLAPWLRRVATNICLDVARSGSARRHREQEYVRRSAAASRPMTTGEMEPLVDELVAELPVQLREPIVLCYLQGVQHSRAAEELGITVGTLRRRIQSAKSMLRSRFAARGIPVSMFLLHMLLGNRAKGAGPSPTGPVAQPPTPVKHSPPQVARTPRLRPAARPGAWGPTSWALKAGLLVVAVGVIPVLYHFLSDDGPAVAAPHVATRSAPHEANFIRETSPPVLDVVEAPVISSRMFEPETVESPGPEPADPPAAPENDLAQESAPQPAPAAESALAFAEQPEAKELEVISIPDGLLTVSVAPGMEDAGPETEVATAETEVAAPETEVATTVKKPARSRRRVRELFGIQWHTTLPSARAAANDQPAKPILCFRVLGNLSGFM